MRDSIVVRVFNKETFRLRYLAIPSQLGVAGLLWSFLYFPNGELVWVNKFGHHSAKYEYSNIDTLWLLILATFLAAMFMLAVWRKAQAWTQVVAWIAGLVLIVFAGSREPEKKMNSPAYVPPPSEVTF